MSLACSHQPLRNSYWAKCRSSSSVHVGLFPFCKLSKWNIRAWFLAQLWRAFGDLSKPISLHPFSALQIEVAFPGPAPDHAKLGMAGTLQPGHWPWKLSILIGCLCIMGSSPVPWHCFSCLLAFKRKDCTEVNRPNCRVSITENLPIEHGYCVLCFKIFVYVVMKGQQKQNTSKPFSIFMLMAFTWIFICEGEVKGFQSEFLH